MSNIPDDLIDIIKELVIIEDELNKDIKHEELEERLYEELPLPKNDDKKIVISLE